MVDISPFPEKGGSLQKWSRSVLESALRNRGALGSAAESAPAGYSSLSFSIQRVHTEHPRVAISATMYRGVANARTAEKQPKALMAVIVL